MKNPDEFEKLMYRISEGDLNAFTRFYNMYFCRVYQFTRYFIKSNEICQEVISDVFLTVWNYRDKITTIHNIGAFLYTIVKNKAYNYLDRVARIPEFTNTLPIEISIDYDNPEDIILIDELQNVIKTAIGKLPEQCKLIFLMSREDDLRYHDIAQILNISEKTVNAQMVTAIKKLHFAIKEYTTLKEFKKSYI